MERKYSSDDWLKCNKIQVTIQAIHIDLILPIFRINRISLNVYARNSNILPEEESL